MIFNVTGGGGTSMNFKVVGGTTQPADPRENTIWVKTEKVFPFCELSGINGIPTWAANVGAIYIQTDGGNWSEPETWKTDTNFVVARKNNISAYLKLTACYQNQDGTASGWKSLDAYIYKSGNWVQFSSVFTAAINVSYPAGSILTCTDGNTTLTAGDTNGGWYFTLPNAGNWTVTATSGSNSASQTVTITTDGQVEQVVLTYTVEIVNSSGQLKLTPETKQFSDNAYLQNYTFTQNTSDWTINVKNSVGGYGGYGAVYFCDIDLASYKTITLVVSASISNQADDSSSFFKLMVWRSMGNGSKDNKAAEAAITRTGQKTTVTLDVSSLTDNYCVGILTHAANSGTCNVYSWTIE